jgi:hypothetical protein
MAPRTVAHLKAPCPVDLPALTPEPWSDFDGSASRPVPFWRQPVTDLPVDQDRTDQLAAWDVAVEHNAGNPPSLSRAAWGIPYQIVDRTVPLTKVWNLSQAGWFPWPWANGWELLPLPSVVRREGDPHEYGDMKWRAWDPEGRKLYETIGLRHAGWPFNRWEIGYVGTTQAAAVWDTTKPWDDPGQPKGVCAAKVPYLPMIPRWDEAISGVVQHALFCSWPNYAPSRVTPARGSDGLWPDYPLQAGHRLRLRVDRLDALWATANRAERSLLLGMHHYGLFVGDKWTTGHPARNSIRAHLTQDRRWHAGDDHSPPPRRQLVRLTDFDVIAP